MRPLLRLTRTLRSSKKSELILPSESMQAVSFDAMDTIITMSEPFSEVYSRVAGDFGFSVDPSKVATSFPEYFKRLSDSHPCFGFRSIGHFEWWKRIVQGCLDEVCVCKRFLLCVTFLNFSSVHQRCFSLL